MLADAFHDNFSLRGDVGASVSVWQAGEEIHHLSGGVTARGESTPWTAETLCPVWSSSKGPAALTTLLALTDSGGTPDTVVQDVWPQLPGRLSFGELLSHRGGFASLDTPAPVLDHAAVVRALEMQTPRHLPGCTQSYHPRTFGFLLDECVRRLTGGATLSTLWRERIADPLGIDFWFGLPESEWPRMARLHPGKVQPPRPGEEAFTAAFHDPASPTRQAFGSPSGLHAVGEMNEPATWQASLPAFGGIGSARALGKFYSVLANGGRWQGERVIPAPVIDWATTVLTDGPDGTLCLPAAFSAGFMLDPRNPATGQKLRQHFGPSFTAFGHPGAGGSHAFADPENGLAFAYVMNQMSTGVLPGAKAEALVTALYAG